MTSHPAITARLSQWRESRAAYQDYLEAQHDAAEAACNGVLVNQRGRWAHVHPASLFLGPWARVQAYASTELLEWFWEHGRLTFEEWEAQHGLIPGRSWGQVIAEATPWSQGGYL